MITHDRPMSSYYEVVGEHGGIETPGLEIKAEDSVKPKRHHRGGSTVPIAGRAKSSSGQWRLQTAYGAWLSEVGQNGNQPVVHAANIDYPQA